MENKVTLEMIQEAREALKGITELTPVVTSSRLGNNLYIKTENLQKTGSFKIRGAFNKIRSLSPEEASRGVIACSAGNHAQGVALFRHQTRHQVRHLHARRRPHPEGGGHPRLRR